jgi:hypothetical protein
MQPKCPIKRRSLRLLNAIHELHKQGYQNLACYFCMSPSGMHWRLTLKYYGDLYENEEGEICQESDNEAEIANHSSGQNGNDYFGWEDSKNANVRELAELIKMRLPRLLDRCKGNNFEYVGWFTYMLGEAEREKLPVFFLEYNEPEPGKIFSTLSGEKLIAPTHLKLQIKHNLRWLWKNYIDISEDWHTAYRPAIDALRTDSISRYPRYPANTKDIIAHGAYWEGAVYYLTKIMGYKNEHEYINDRIYTNTRWQEFEIIFNSEGQLHLFDAHMARVALTNNKEVMSVKLIKECEKSHRDIELIYGEIKYPYPNPFFGGDNPLHLCRLDQG